MDQEERIFYENQLGFFGEGQNNEFNEDMPISFRIKENAPEISLTNHLQTNSGYFRAYNPLERLKDMPQEKQSEYFFMFNNHKRFNGIQHFFEFGTENKFSSEFLENIQIDALGNNTSGDFQLDKLFHCQQKNAYKEQLQNTIMSLNKRIEQISLKMINNMNLHKTISPAFYQHFQNYSMVLGQSHFIRELENNLKNMINNSKKIKGPGIELISSLYQFWMKSFKDFVNQIWKYSSKFTLNFFKKNQPQQHSDAYSDIRSESSNTIGSKDKRKGWTPQQTQILQQFINSNIIFSQSVLKKIAEQLNRSVSSISSKIQKLIKDKKGDEDIQEESLLRKTIEILKIHPQGLNKESIVQKLNENYEMGYGGQWQKSVGQLLSNRKEFLKLKSKHKLLNPELYKPINFSQYDPSKLTFKDKVIQLFLLFPNASADSKTLVEKYLTVFEDNPDPQAISQDRKKSIEANLSKTLSRYEIFDSKTRTIYLLNPLFSRVQARNMEIQVDEYFQL